jgi:hypothetical protein
MSRSIYVGPGSTPALPGRHIYFSAEIYICGPEYSDSGLVGRNIFVLGRIRLFPASSSYVGPRLGLCSSGLFASSFPLPGRQLGPGWASVRAARLGRRCATSGWAAALAWWQIPASSARGI